MPTFLQNLTFYKKHANMHGTWVYMVSKRSNHVGMKVLHGSQALKAMDYSVLIYVNNSLQLDFGGCKTVLSPYNENIVDKT